jgi:NAD(P)-dependent dehydrogenase (short-subunit alcohol dehydrogenase family)
MSTGEVKSVLVLGGQGEFSIGSSCAGVMNREGWVVHHDDCQVFGGGYDVPEMHQFGKLGALVVALGTCSVGPIHEMPEDDIDDIIRACLTLPVFAAKEFVDCGHTGDIVFIGSYNHDHVLSQGTAYCAAKAGLDMAMRSLAWECNPHHHRFFSVNPYQVPHTPMSDAVVKQVAKAIGASEDVVRADAQRDRKLNYSLSPGDVAQTVAHILTAPLPVRQWQSGASIDMYGGVR